MREREQGLDVFLGAEHLAAQVMEPGHKPQGKGQALRVRQLPGQGERLLGARQGLTGISQTPEGPGRKAPTSHPRVTAIEGHMGAVLLRVVEGYSLVRVLSGRDKLSNVDQGTLTHPIGLQEQW